MAIPFHYYMKNELEIHVLASGSKGNCAVVRYGKTALLIDAGISCKRIVEGLQTLGIMPEDIVGVCITHEHSDHVSGVPQLLKNFEYPIYATKGTCYAMQQKVSGYSHCYVAVHSHSWRMGDFYMRAFPTYHDAADPVGFVVQGGSKKASFLTDTGIVTKSMIQEIEGSNLLVLEANYDLEMLTYGPYHAALKKRVAGKYGHLSNEEAARVLVESQLPSTAKVVLAHRSEQNNSLFCVESTFSRITQAHGMDWVKGIHYVHGQAKEMVSIG